MIVRPPGTYAAEGRESAPARPWSGTAARYRLMVYVPGEDKPLDFGGDPRLSEAKADAQELVLLAWQEYRAHIRCEVYCVADDSFVFGVGKKPAEEG